MCCVCVCVWGGGCCVLCVCVGVCVVCCVCVGGGCFVCSDYDSLLGSAVGLIISHTRDRDILLAGQDPGMIDLLEW